MRSSSRSRFAAGRWSNGRLRLGLPAAALLAQACSGDIGDNGARGAPNEPVGGDPSALCAEGLAVPMQRIDVAQFRTLVADLFGPSVVVDDGFPVPLTGYPYSTYAAANPMGEGQTEAVLEAAEAVAMQVADLVPACDGDETACATEYLTSLAARAFRRPASAEEVAELVGVYARARAAAEPIDYAESVALAVGSLLQTPPFLYVLERQPSDPATPSTLDGLEIAQRMALLYWNGLPDAELLGAAQSGALADPSARLAHAKRMLADPRAQAVVGDFLLQWMSVKGFHADVHPPDLQQALDREMELEIEDALASEDGLTELLTSRHAHVNSVLEEFYGLPSLSGGPDDWREVDLDPQQRVGILTHPLLLAKLAHGQTPSPIFRGKFVRVMVMCGDIAPPPPGAAASQPDLAPPGATIREQSQARLDNPVCGGCHRQMDPIGFGFSAFDGAGRFVPVVDGAPVDTTGHIEGGGDLEGDFDGVRELGDALAQSPDVRECLARQWMRYAIGAEERPVDQCSVDALAEQYGGQSRTFRDLFAGVSALDSFVRRQDAGAEP